MVFLLPANAAHAASPTVTSSVTSTTVGSSITLTGVGFASAASVVITSTLGTSTTVAWLTPGTCTTTTNGGTGQADSLDVTTSGHTCLTTNAAGNFQTTVTVPALTGGTQTITVSDGTSTATTTVTISPSISIVKTGTSTAYTSGYPESTQSVDIKLTGFGALDAITLTGTSAFSGFPTSATASSAGSYTFTGTGLTVIDTTGGAKTITATGSSSLTASTTFTIKPWVAFYNTQIGGTTFSFFGTAPTSLYVEGHGFSNTAVAANSITLSGIATTHAAFTPASDGTFGIAPNAHELLSPTANVPFGQTSVVIQGNTFNLANGNIAMGSGAVGTPVLGGILISSITGGGTGIAALDASSYGYGASPTIYGYGYTNGHAITISNLATALPGITFAATANSIQTLTTNSQGAFFVSSTGTTLSDIGAGTYTVTVTDGVDSSISPSYTVTPMVSLSFGDSGTAFSQAINYKSTGLTVSIHGFSTTATSVSVTAGGLTLATITPASCAQLATNGGCLNAAVTTPDLARQQWTATASDGTNTATATFSVEPLVDFNGANGALTLNSGTAGTVTVLRTGGSGATGFGVHGLAASTTYTVNAGMIGASGTITLGTFTTTATGGIPVPGVQFALPSAVTGIQTLTLVSGGADALFGTCNPTAVPIVGYTCPTASSLGPTSQYGDLLFSETASILTSPTVVNVGTTFTLSGTGLTASTTYVETVSLAAGAANANGQIFGTFTTTASGSIPSSASLVMPPAATIGAGNCATGTYAEQGTPYYVHLSTASQYPGHEDGEGSVVLAAAVNLNATSEPAGHVVTLTATGLGDGCTYNVIFNYGTNPAATAYTGTLIGAFTATATGSTPGGGVTVTIPSNAAAGVTYPIQLIRLTGPALGVLSIPAQITTGSVSNACANQGTACMSINGAPTVSKQSGNTIITASFTNNSNQPLTGYVYAVVHNALGQTVYYTTATINPSASGSTTGQLVLFGLPTGTYTATVFVVSTSGTAISTTTSVSVTI